MTHEMHGRPTDAVHKRKHRGRSPLRTLLVQHPDLLVDTGGDMVLHHPLSSEGLANTDLVEVRDRRDGKLLAKQESSGFSLRCQRGHTLLLSHREFAQCVTVARSAMNGLALQLQCESCDPPAPVITFLAEGGIRFDAIEENLTD